MSGPGADSSTATFADTIAAPVVLSESRRSRFLVPVVKRSALVPHRAADMYALVDAIERYPDFLPWCSSATVHRRTGKEVEASLEIARGPVRKSFRTRNRLHPWRLIEISLVAGPFRRLEGRWQFEPLAQRGCRVSLQLEFAFSNRAVQTVLNPIFSEIADSLVDAFCRRATEQYGRCGRDVAS